MDNEQLQEIIKKELSYKDEQLNKIYRITEEDSYEDYEPETELYKDLLAIRLAEQNSEKFNMYFKNANKNDVLNKAYMMTPKEKSDFVLTQGELFDYNNNFEKSIIDSVIRTIKRKGFLMELNLRKLSNADPNELGKLLGNEANSIIVTNAVLAELRSRYNLNFKLFTDSGIDKKAYVNNDYQIEQYLDFINNENSSNLGGYCDYFNKMQINITLNNKAYGEDHEYCQQNLLKTLYHETRHAIMFNRIRNRDINKEEYIIAKNLEYVIKHPVIYKVNHDYFEAEIDADEFSEKQVREDYKNSNISIFKDYDITLNRNTKKYDQINNITMYSPDVYINTLAKLEYLKLDKLIKILYNDEFLPYDLKCYLVKMSIKNHKFNGVHNLNELELRYLKGFLEDIKKEETEKIMSLAQGSKNNFVKNGNYYLKELEKFDKVAKKIK